MIDRENLQLAEIFERIADFLDMKGENPFKGKAYQKAARTLQGLGSPIRELHNNGELLRLSGMGKALAEKAVEFLNTGTIRYYENLKSEFPEHILDLMLVPGLGPKRAAILHEKLGVGSLEDLQRVVLEGKIRDLKGFGPKSEVKLLEGLQQMKQGEERMNLGEARYLADSLCEFLRAQPGVEQVVAAGSLRRGRESVGDIDLLCIASDPSLVMDQFCAQGEPVAHGPTKSSIRWQNRIQIDLRVVPRDSFGAALQYFTGSKDHNVKLRGICVKKGWLLNEYGLFDENGDVIASRTEEEIYAALGLPCYPPELRETGEEVGQEVPELLTVDDVRGNLHTHSHYSDGSDTLEELVEHAMKLGHKYLAITDHSRSLVVANGLSIERLMQVGAEISGINARLGDKFRVLWGTECDILSDGRLDYPDEVLAQLDLVVASVHSAFTMNKSEMTQRILKAVSHPHVHILAHPSGRLLGRRAGYDADWEEIFRAAAKHGTALEINASGRRLDLSDQAARRARELGATLTINTDAHSLDEFNFLPLGISVARRARLGPKDILNSRTVEELLAWAPRSCPN